jgi:hypothetical protein
MPQIMKRSGPPQKVLDSIQGSGVAHPQNSIPPAFRQTIVAAEQEGEQGSDGATGDATVPSNGALGDYRNSIVPPSGFNVP